MNVSSKLNALALVALVPLWSCDAQPIEGEGGSDIPESVQQAFDDACVAVGCHAAGSSAGGLNLEAGSSDAILSLASSTGVPYVTIGDLANSYLALKILPPSSRPEGSPSVSGQQMPIGGSRPAETAVIIAWIAGLDVEGALGGGCFGPQSYPADISFADHVYPILQGGCITAGCHTASENALLLPTDDAQGAYDLLVDVPSVRMTSAQMSDPTVMPLDYVEMGTPDQSYLWLKITGTHREVNGGGGLPMPPSGALCSSDMNAVYRWIFEGAAP